MSSRHLRIHASSSAATHLDTVLTGEGEGMRIVNEYREALTANSASAPGATVPPVDALRAAPTANSVKIAALPAPTQWRRSAPVKMRFVDEFRDPELARVLAREIARLVDP